MLSSPTNHHHHHQFQDQVQVLTSNPITSTILSTPTHPDFSNPLSAVFKAGHQSPGQSYSQSPSIKNLSKILQSNSNNTTAYHQRPEHDQDHHHLKSLDHPINLYDPFSIWFNDLSKRLASSSQNRRSESQISNHHQFLEAQSSDHSRCSSSTSTQSIDPQATNSSTFKRWFSRIGPSSSSNLTITFNQQQDRELDHLNRVSDPSQLELDTPLQSDQPSLRTIKKPKHPLVLCHGLLGFDTLGPQALGLSYFRGIKLALESNGVEVHVAKVPACASIEERAKALAGFIENRLPGRTVNLIGHSMGGLDSRFLISHLKPTSFKVASLTTIATPHRGSSFADYLLLDIVGRENLPRLLQVSKLAGIPGGGRAFEELTMERMARFNDQTPDDRSVSYFSYGASFQPTITSLFRLPWSVIYEREGPNDGFVSVHSSRWGHYYPTLENVNHADLVGWSTPWRAAGDPTGKSKFNAVAFYLDIVDALATEGF